MSLKPAGTGERMATHMGCQRVGEVGLKAGIPDAVNLLFDVGNGTRGFTRQPFGQKRRRRIKWGFVMHCVH